MNKPQQGEARRDQESQDEHFMRRALQLAHETIGLASPNPQVGCVLVQNGQIIGEGAHHYDLRDHAEIVALKQAVERGHQTANSTAYVTLEPCAHHGRTGPCADALIGARIVRCVIATEDPNPLVCGQGIARLRAAGIQVTLGTLQQQARDLNDPFAHFIQHHRPFVILKAALSADGKLAPPQHTRSSAQPHWLTGPLARAEVHRLRHAADAILTGIGTVLADNPTLTDRSGMQDPDRSGMQDPDRSGMQDPAGSATQEAARSGIQDPARISLPRRRPLLRAVLDTHLRIPLASQLLRSADHDLLILHRPISADLGKAAALRAEGAELLAIPIDPRTGQLSLPATLEALAERSILSLLLETGSRLNGSFLAQNLVDKVTLFYAQTELGDAAIPFAEGFPSPFLLQQSFHRLNQSTLGPDAMVTGYLHDPWTLTSNMS